MINDNIKRLENTFSELKERASQLKTTLEIENFYKETFGKTGIFVVEMSKLKTIKNIEIKKTLGPYLNKSKNEVLEIINNKKRELELQKINKDMKTRWVPLGSIDREPLGFLHPIQIVTRKIDTFLQGEGFIKTDHSPVETVEHNFTNLNVAKDHPAFDKQDTFFISKTNENNLLRAHCTSSTSRELKKNRNREFSSYDLGEVFRRDTDDATHSHQFIQLDAILVKEGATVKDLRKLLTNLVNFLFQDNVEIRFRPSYFPFTTPSFELDIKCPIKGDHNNSCICKGTNWIEVLGAGMVHKEVFNNAGYTNKTLTGYAFGMGVDRLTCLLFGIPDIRLLYENRLDFLQQFTREIK